MTSKMQEMLDEIPHISENEVIIFDLNDLWNVNTLKLDRLIQKIHEAARDDAEDAEIVMEQVFKNHMEHWQWKRELTDLMGD